VNWLEQFTVEKALLLTLVLARISGLVMTAPIYGAQEAPRQVRALLAIALAALVLPSQWHVGLDAPGSLPMYALLLGGELLLGACLGLGLVVLFSGIQLAGELIGRMGGLMVADVFDPTIEASVPLVSRLMFLVALAVFVLIGGHRVVMAGLLDTFAAVPPGGAGLPEGIVDGFVMLLAQSFALGVRAAAPVVTALLLSTLVMGLISRTLPQLNILIVGFGMNSMLMFAVLLLALGAAAWAFQGQVEPALETLLDALGVARRAEMML
jgi:flagellar biosynthesis protein FliR